MGKTYSIFVDTGIREDGFLNLRLFAAGFQTEDAAIKHLEGTKGYDFLILLTYTT